jgi:hypothetical protein
MSDSTPLNLLLSKTLLGQATSYSDWRTDFSTLPVGEAAPEVGVTTEDKAIWSWDSPVFGGEGVQVTNVTCKVSSMGYMKMQVLDLIEWGPVVVKFGSFDTNTLPLTKDFLICTRYALAGSVSSSPGAYWQLPANTDQSFEMVFGYELPFTGWPSSPAPGAPVPLALASIDYPDFVEHPYEFPASHTDRGGPAVVTLRPRPLRIILVVSLVCCKERYDFDPGSVLGAGRIYPYMMAVANSPLNQLTGSVKLSRPERSSHSEIMGEKMTSNIGSVFFTDRNDPGIIARVYWDNLFAYYYVDPPPAKYTMVTPSSRGRNWTVRGGVTVHELQGVSDEKTEDRDILKIAGQGEFDNIHLAPKMVFPKEVLENPLNRGLYGLENVAMAPFCIHDCFHLHCRWSDGPDDPQVKGWVANRPFVKAGAPLVPGNQEVTMEMHSPVSFTYTATAEQCRAGEWQIILHHGGAYALSVGKKGWLAREAVLTSIPMGLDYNLGDLSTWAKFYWCLRYNFDWYKKDGRSQIRQFERLSWTPEQFAALRAKGPAKPEGPPPKHRQHGKATWGM